MLVFQKDYRTLVFSLPIPLYPTASVWKALVWKQLRSAHA